MCEPRGNGVFGMIAVHAARERHGLRSIAVAVRLIPAMSRQFAGVDVPEPLHLQQVPGRSFGWLKSYMMIVLCVIASANAIVQT